MPVQIERVPVPGFELKQRIRAAQGLLHRPAVVMKTVRTCWRSAALALATNTPPGTMPSVAGMIMLQFFMPEG